MLTKPHFRRLQEDPVTTRTSVICSLLDSAFRLYGPRLNSLSTHLPFNLWPLSASYLPCTFYNRDHHCIENPGSRYTSYSTLPLQGRIPKEYKPLQNTRKCHFLKNTKIFFFKVNVQAHYDNHSSTNSIKFLGIMFSIISRAWS